MKRASVPTPRKDSAGKWSFVFDSATPNPDGTRRQVRRRGFVTKGAAQTALDVALREDRSLTGTVDGLTVGSVLAQFVRTKRLAGKAPGTLAFYEWAASHAHARWGGWPALKLTADHLDAAYLAMLGEAMSVRSVQALHKTVKAAYALAVNKGQLVRNPAALATPPATVEPKRCWYSPAQVGTFLRYVAGLEHPPLPTALLDTLVDTGGRRGEVLGLRWEDIDLDAGTATITRQITAHPTTKALEVRPTKRPRSKSIVGLHPGTVAALRQRRAQQHQDRLLMGAGWPKDSLHTGLVFTWPNGEAIHPDTVTRVVGRLSVQAGLPHLTPHGLRHAFASAALSARVPVEVVAARLGNTARVVQEVYAHVIPADDQAAAQVVGDLYRAPLVTGL
ncbi:MAG TPA: tyrosine-type recombinase/integrase [Acidimicrobiales bacterium]|nr:tyrosine-type recombinase/integrase [Acidimicrobiales bacterium]